MKRTYQQQRQRWDGVSVKCALLTLPVHAKVLTGRANAFFVETVGRPADKAKPNGETSNANWAV